jgi:hypothetical protein
VLRRRSCFDALDGILCTCCEFYRFDNLYAADHVVEDMYSSWWPKNDCHRISRLALWVPRAKCTVLNKFTAWCYEAAL